MDSHVGALDVLEDNAHNLLVLAEFADDSVPSDLGVPRKGGLFLDKVNVVEGDLSLQSL